MKRGEGSWAVHYILQVGIEKQVLWVAGRCPTRSLAIYLVPSYLTLYKTMKYQGASDANTSLQYDTCCVSGDECAWE